MKNKKQGKLNSLKKKVLMGLLLGTAILVPMMPSAYALPSQGTYASSNASTVATSVNTMNITGTTENNVINWNTFSIENGETVNFTDSNNYLNLVNGVNQSAIYGTLSGAGNIYLVNPNGIIFGSNASVNVGSLIASTRAINDVNITDFKAGENPITNSTITSAVGNITNLGNIQASNVVLEGNEVIIQNSANVNSATVTIKAADDITVGHKVITQVDLDETEGVTLNAAAYANAIIPNSGYSATDLAGTDKDITEAFLVEDVYDLQNMKAKLFANYLLANDIDASETSDITKWSDTFTPVGTSAESSNFIGTFNGAGFVIDTLTILKASDGNNGVNNVGLFGYTDDASIKNVGLENGSVIGNYHVGGLVGYSNGDLIISNSYNTGTVSGNEEVGGLVGASDFNDAKRIIINSYNTGEVRGYEEIGGLIGHNDDSLTISNSYNTGTVSSVSVSLDTRYDGGFRIGGLVGSNDGNLTISNSYNAGAVSGDATTNDSRIGGLIGYHDEGNLTISNSYNEGDISGANNIGGLVGKNNDGDNLTISNSYNIGNISGGNNIGGLIGSSDGAITIINNNSYNKGTVSGDEYVGGLVGINNDNLTISNSYNVEDVIGNVDSDSNYIGGLVGYNEKNLTIINSYNTGNISAESEIGGLVGESYGDALTINNSYNTGDVSGGEYVGGLIGDADSDIITINNSYNTGNISGSDYYIGGLVGYNEEVLTINNSYNTGDVSGSEYVGGLIGYSNGNLTIINSYNIGDVSGSEYVGGLISYNDDDEELTIINSYYATTDANGNSINQVSTNYGVGKTYEDILQTITLDSANEIATIESVLPTVGNNDNSEITIETVNDSRMNVSGNDVNNVVKWDTFSIAEDYSVYFEDAKNYLNLVTGENSSDIKGSIFGDGNIYLVNPNGMIFGSSASINVGSLIASTRAISNDNITDFQAGLNPITNSTISSVVGNITNLGNIQAPSLVLEGNEVIIQNADNVNSPTVTIKATDDITVGHEVTTQVDLDETEGVTLNAADYASAFISISGYIATDLEGTEKDIKEAFLVEDVYDLQNMNAKLDANYLLANDIDASETSDTTKWTGTFTPVATITSEGNTEDQNFTGTFNGAGFVIDGLTILKASDSQVGLFGYTNGVSIKNVGLENGSVSGNVDVGGLVGCSNGDLIINNSYNKSDVNGNNDVGGLVGSHDNKALIISNSYNTGNISGSDYYIGGLVGEDYGDTLTLNNSYNTGDVSGYEYVGGLIGDADPDIITTINNSYNTGNIIGSKYYIGGLVGYNDENLTINNSYNTGNISGSDYYIGGLVGESYGDALTINNSYNTGDVSGGEYVGGLIGDADSDITTINNSYNTGNIIGSKYYIGGLVGYNEEVLTINNSYNTGDVSGSEYVGGLIGVAYDPLTINNSYNIGDVSGSEYVGGLIGENDDNLIISNFYNTGAVNGDEYVGGFIGESNGDLTIINSYNTGLVNGAKAVGGLIGYNDDSYDVTILNVYNTGDVSGDEYVGGLVGFNDYGYESYEENLRPEPVGENDYNLAVLNSYYATTDANGIAINEESTKYGIGKTYEEMMQASTYGFVDELDTTGGQDMTWRMYEGYTTPLLKVFMETVDIKDTVDEYSGVEQIGTVIAVDGRTLNTNIQGNVGTDIGEYTIYSDQQGYDLVSTTGLSTPVYTIIPSSSVNPLNPIMFYGMNKEYNEIMAIIKHRGLASWFSDRKKFKESRNDQVQISNNGVLRGLSSLTYDPKSDSILIPSLSSRYGKTN